MTESTGSAEPGKVVPVVVFVEVDPAAVRSPDTAAVYAVERALAAAETELTAPTRGGGQSPVHVRRLALLDLALKEGILAVTANLPRETKDQEQEKR
ncbi:hypothetical protein JNUCC0626_50320 (plasmid) [Lentzea sp. JNUCC 0626]|uniref:hypothetical protein n=1 Tax=Lentzea sp. JNUCC 0626 TaxID=3367513 RepID=UPI003747E3CB